MGLLDVGFKVVDFVVEGLHCLGEIFGLGVLWLFLSGFWLC